MPTATDQRFVEQFGVDVEALIKIMSITVQIVFGLKCAGQLSGRLVGRRAAQLLLSVGLGEATRL